MTVSSLYAGMRTATRGVNPCVAPVVRPAQTVDYRKQAHDDKSRAHQDIADEEDHHDEVAHDVDSREGDGVGQRADPLPEGQRRHHLRCGLAHQVRDRHDLVAVGAQRVNQRTGSASTVAWRFPPPSCIRMMEPRNCGLVFMVCNCASTDCAISSGVLRGCSFQSSVSILLPMMV